MEIEQAVPQQQQQTRTGRFCKCLFSFIFYTQLILISVFVIFLTLRGLVFNKSHTFHPKKWYTPLLSSVALSGILSLAWNYLFIRNIPATVKATVLITPVLTISVAILLIFYHRYTHPWMARLIGTPLFVCSLFSAIYYHLLVPETRKRFSFQMMSIATGILPEGTRALSAGSTILSVLYSGFLVAGIGGATATRTRFGILFTTILIISLAWTMQVLKNIQLAAISKARYVYFKRHELMNAWNALCASLKKSLGNVCIGSTLVPLIVFVRQIIRYGSADDEAIYKSTVGLYAFANHVILWGNRYGFVRVGDDNKGFVQASSDTWMTFRTVDGFEQLIDLDITSFICLYRAVGIGSISALTAGIWELLIEKDHFFELTLYAAIIGYFVGRVSSAWLQACVMGYYVAYSEDPQSNNFDNTIPHRIQRQRIENVPQQDVRFTIV